MTLPPLPVQLAQIASQGGHQGLGGELSPTAVAAHTRDHTRL